MKTQPILTMRGLLDNKYATYQKFTKLIHDALNGKIKNTRTNCFEINDSIKELISNFLQVNDIECELFIPENDFPHHVDSYMSNLTYMIPLTPGNFIYDGIRHSITQFCVYSFDDSIPHNSDFPAIMVSLIPIK